jgi:hypothetical protein
MTARATPAARAPRKGKVAEEAKTSTAAASRWRPIQRFRRPATAAAILAGAGDLCRRFNDGNCSNHWSACSIMGKYGPI